MHRPATLAAVLTACSPCACCPGFYPLLEDHERQVSYEETTSVDRNEGRKRLASWLRAHGPVTGPIGVAGTGRYQQIAESKPDGEVKARYIGYCVSPPAEPGDDPWRLELDVAAQFEDRKVNLTFSRVVLLWPTLGDNASNLTHGDKRAPRTKQDMKDITRNCLLPLKKSLLAAIAKPAVTPSGSAPPPEIESSRAPRSPQPPVAPHSGPASSAGGHPTR